MSGAGAHGAAAPAVAGMPEEHRMPTAGPRRRILLIAPTRELSFVQEDIRILSQEHDLTVLARHDFSARRKLLVAVARELRGRRPALMLVWFAEPSDSPFLVLMSRALRIPVGLVVGGYEVADLPELGYGGAGTRSARWQLRLAFRGATLLLPTSDLLAREIQAFGRTAPVRRIYPGIDGTLFRPGAVSRERLVLTVGTISRATMALKGLDTFAACARRLRDARFVIIGPCPEPDVAEELRRLGGEGLTLIDRRLPRVELVSWYQRAAVYAQLSARESFGVAVAEAMACGCTPVVTKVGALPEVVGATGEIVPFADPEAAAAAIERALAAGDGAAARERIVRLFPLEERTRQLGHALGALMPGATS